MQQQSNNAVKTRSKEGVIHQQLDFKKKNYKLVKKINQKSCINNQVISSIGNSKIKDQQPQELEVPSNNQNTINQKSRKQIKFDQDSVTKKNLNEAKHIKQNQNVDFILHLQKNKKKLINFTNFTYQKKQNEVQDFSDNCFESDYKLDYLHKNTQKKQKIQKMKNSKRAQGKNLINPDQIFEEKSLSYENINIEDYANLDGFEFDGDFEICEKPASKNKNEKSNCSSQGGDCQEPEDTCEQQKKFLDDFAQDLRSQENSRNQSKAFKCQFCAQMKEFSSYKLLLEHQSIEHPFDLLELRGYGFWCKHCYKYFERETNRSKHEDAYCHNRKSSQKPMNQYQSQVERLYQSAKAIQRNRNNQRKIIN
ncbi:hypothetical protein ABPG72_017571 [Tetrahymena utriculariae]